MKRQKKGLMSIKQYGKIAKQLEKMVPCNLLVFGLGDDSYLWRNINKQGNTIFLEDDPEWINSMNDGSLDVFQVNYTTKVEDHEKIGFEAEKLNLVLPERVRSMSFNFIIVDAPLGHQPPRPHKGPGRMSSIYTASQLIDRSGVVVVDDMGREVEKKYAFHYLGQNNLVEIVEGKVGIFDFAKNE